MGNKNSSKTRVEPVFDQLKAMDHTGKSWLSKLLNLIIGGNTIIYPKTCNFSIEKLAYGSCEEALDPPVSLLSWIIRYPRGPNSGELSSDPIEAKKRQEWIDGSDSRILEGLSLLRNNSHGENWHIFEGKSQPDVFIKTPDLLVVIEGKRTERKPTTSTKWMKNRHQMIRHVDCAWEIKCRRQVIGFFIVEGNGVQEEIPSVWLEYAKETTATDTLAESLPHRGIEERKSIAGCFAGVTTWQRICREFNINWQCLPNLIDQK